MDTRTPQVTETDHAPGGGARIVLTAPLTETIDHAGYFIQMSMASLPMWLEGILNKKYPKWREVEYNDDGSARYMPAGVRVPAPSLSVGASVRKAATTRSPRSHFCRQ